MFKFLILAATLCIMAATSPFSQANEYERMLEGMTQLERCLDVSYLDELTKDGEKVSNQIEQLCHAGQRQKAQNMVLDYAQELQKNPNFQSMMKCLAKIDSDVPGASHLQEAFDMDRLHKTNVCDELESFSVEKAQ